MRTPSRAAALLPALLLPLLLPARVSAREIIPLDICARLGPVSPELRRSLEERFPEIGPEKVVVVPDETAKDWLKAAVGRGMSSVHFFTQQAWRSSCRLIITPEALVELDRDYALELVTPIQGKDVKGRRFQMDILLSGKGAHHIVYSFDGTAVFLHPDFDEKFEMSKNVFLNIPSYGDLRIDGLIRKGFFFDLPLERIRAVNGKLNVTVGGWVVERPMTPITRRGTTTEPSSFLPDEVLAALSPRRAAVAPVETGVGSFSPGMRKVVLTSYRGMGLAPRPLR